LPTNSAFAPSAGRCNVIEIPIRPQVVMFPAFGQATPRDGGCASPKDTAAKSVARKTIGSLHAF
jgi:hypothetical protein